MKKQHLTILSLCLIGLALTGCAGSPVGNLIGNVEDSKTKALLKSMIGHPLNELVAEIGTPQSSVQDMLATEKTYMHTWTIKKYARDKFVKTGTEYAGTKVTTIYSTGQGVVGAQPIYEDQYRDVGYNAPTYYTCLINVYTDANGVIIKKEDGLYNVVGGFCDEFLNLK